MENTDNDIVDSLSTMKCKRKTQFVSPDTYRYYRVGRGLSKFVILILSLFYYTMTWII